MHLNQSHTIANGQETKSHAQTSDRKRRSKLIDAHPVFGQHTLALLSPLIGRASLTHQTHHNVAFG
jgi:hypothetical protein